MNKHNHPTRETLTNTGIETRQAPLTSIELQRHLDKHGTLTSDTNRRRRRYSPKQRTTNDGNYVKEMRRYNDVSNGYAKIIKLQRRAGIVIKDY